MFDYFAGNGLGTSGNDLEKMTQNVIVALQSAPLLALAPQGFSMDSWELNYPNSEHFFCVLLAFD